MTNSGATKYYLMKKCLQCFAVCEFQLNRCSQCNHLFIGEATQEEKQEIYKKLEELQKKKDEEGG